jgi:ATP-dependent helicase/nuclease subunit A
MGVLVDWPGEAAHPARFVFLVSESNPSACAVDAMATERMARSREELNGLYVALTRARQTLVISSMEPKIANPGSWWKRLQGFANEAAVAAESALTPVVIEPSDTAFVMSELPARAAISAPAGATQQGAVQQGAPAQESLESRIGQAMHRLLEWLPVVPGGYAATGLHPQSGLWTAAQCALAAREFALEAGDVASAWRMAAGIAQGTAAWCWDAAALQWHANEVPVNRAKRLLRIDRLLQDRAGIWWVLDYKSNAQPQLQADLCAQLTGYRATVQSAYPAQTVRCAFLTPQGALIEISTP